MDGGAWCQGARIERSHRPPERAVVACGEMAYRIDRAQVEGEPEISGQGLSARLEGKGDLA